MIPPLFFARLTSSASPEVNSLILTSCLFSFLPAYSIDDRYLIFETDLEDSGFLFVLDFDLKWNGLKFIFSFFLFYSVSLILLLSWSISFSYLSAIYSWAYSYSLYKDFLSYLSFLNILELLSRIIWHSYFILFDSKPFALLSAFLSVSIYRSWFILTYLAAFIWYSRSYRPFKSTFLLWL